MKEYKSIEVMDNCEMHLHQESTLYNQPQMSQQKDRSNCRNNPWKWFQLMQEYKSIEVVKLAALMEQFRNPRLSQLSLSTKPRILGILGRPSAAKQQSLC
jgi:hypothetical protein